MFPLLRKTMERGVGWDPVFIVRWSSHFFKSLNKLVSEAAGRVVQLDTQDETGYHSSNSSDHSSTLTFPSNHVYLPYSNHGDRHHFMIPALKSRKSFMEVLRNVSYLSWTSTSILALIIFQLAVIVIHDALYFLGYGTYKSTLDSVETGIFSLFTLEIICRGILHYGIPRDITARGWTWPFDDIFNAFDVTAIIAFWSKLVVSAAADSPGQIVQLLSMLSALRISRLLRITPATDKETSVIIAALKDSSAKLAKVASFICFFWLLFGVIGIQTFHSSLRRSCVLPASPDLPTLATSQHNKDVQFCGSYVINDTLHSWLRADGSPVDDRPRGYSCPRGMICQEGTNPYNNTVSFDNIFQSLELVFVIFSANTFSTLMYNTIDSEGLLATLFFIAVIIVLYFWLVILLIGVITGSIQEIRHRTKVRTANLQPAFPQQTSSMSTPKASLPVGPLLRFLERTQYFWIMIITFGVIMQSLRSADMSPSRKDLIDRSETVVTFSLLAEIIIRAISFGKVFFFSKRNLVDLGLATVTSIMQIPYIRECYAGRVYTWFTFFQIARCYRVFWALPMIRQIMVLAFSAFPSLLQLCAFLFLLVIFAAILARRMFMMETQGPDDRFTDLWKSFLAMYQIFTGEDWTETLYAVTSRNPGKLLAGLGAIFIIGWFILSSIIVLNMFLARIDESFNLPERERRIWQVQTFLRKEHSLEPKIQGHDSASMAKLQSCASRERSTSSNVIDLHMKSLIEIFTADETVLGLFSPEVVPARDLWKPIKLKSLLGITYNTSRSDSITKKRLSTFFSRSQNFCRLLVIPSGQPWSLLPGDVFRIFIYTSVVAQVAITCVTTPLYQREYFLKHQYSTFNWLVKVDLAFATLWSLEASLKIIAGGLFRGENAFLRGWNLIDAVVLVTSWAGIILSLHNYGSIAHRIACFKAFRVLRLLTINEKMMTEVTMVLRRGGIKVIASVLVSLSLLFPFAIYGLNIFVGLSMTCNDPLIMDFHDCITEFDYSGQQGVLMPRVVSRPYYSFDNFGQSLYTLFLIVSQDGWTEVMYWARGVSTTPYMRSDSISNINALFFVVFNFCGTIFVTALFAAVMIQNYTEATGVAYLTRHQRSWIEQRRILDSVRPHRRPTPQGEFSSLKKVCYVMSVKKDGIWWRFVTALYIFYLLLLCTEFHPASEKWILVRPGLLRAILIFLSINMIARIHGLTLKFFLRRPWDLLSAILLPAGLATSIIQSFFPKNFSNNYAICIIQPLIAILVIPYISTFQNLLSIAYNSVPLVTTLLTTWIVLLLFFAIGLNQTFGLTRFNSYGTSTINFRNIPNSIVLLFRMTLGEGRTKIMEDFAAVKEPYCTRVGLYYEDDCGDEIFARVFLISWKVLSTYLFTSLFVSLVFDSFSHVYQKFPLISGILENDDIRAFKDAWAVFDPTGTGYITPESLPKFTNAITGHLSLRVHDTAFSAEALRSDAEYAVPLHPGDLNIVKLHERLNGMDVSVVRERRRTMNRYRMELFQHMQLDKRTSSVRIPMKVALLTLFYYKLVDLREYLPFDEYVTRAERLRDVDEALRREYLTGLVKIWRCKKRRRERWLS
ncbi:unnamed protein product [Periconia digitata]|uniref:Calcium-channel protein CCH1 n=1 Tax=Periconia digitata TaxID=1303443 RepID=A0A9W4UPN0_9PLEO|nr:unnamed protein product [Periconia digitata]